MKCGSQIAVAVVGGYVLGRSRKTRLAALLALLAAGGGKLPVGPEDLLRKTPLGGQLDKLTGDLRGQIVDAGMSVAKRAASSRIDSFSDRLQERAETLRGTGGRQGEEAEEAEEAEPERTRPRRRRAEPPQRRREEPGRRERAREEPSRRERTREPEYDEDEYDEYDDYDRDENDRDEYDDDYDRDDRRDDRDEYDERDEQDEQDEPERPRRERRPQARSSRPEPRRRGPRRDDDRSRRGRSPR